MIKNNFIIVKITCNEINETFDYGEYDVQSKQ